VANPDYARHGSFAHGPDAMTGDRLTPLDATFLELEETDEAGPHAHRGPDDLRGATGPAADAQARRRFLERRIGALPRYRCRLSEPHTGGLRWPAGVIDPDFDIAAHVEQVELPAPGGQAELLDWAADYWSQRLDRSRPLWEARLVTGFADGRWAVATKTTTRSSTESARST
jgi:diacylglycerol O-acyltransferase / wax synthase